MRASRQLFFAGGDVLARGIATGGWMGGRPRQKQQNLAKKLLRIRNALGLSQIELVRAMRIEGRLVHHRISEYESGRREPALATLLAYARVAGVHLEDIVNDYVDLPDKLPGKVKHPGPN